MKYLATDWTEMYQILLWFEWWLYQTLLNEFTVIYLTYFISMTEFMGATSLKNAKF